MNGILSYITGTLKDMVNMPGQLLYISKSFRIGLLLLISFIPGFTVEAQVKAGDTEDISILVDVEGAGSFYTDALYSDDGKLYLPVEELFNYFKVACQPDRSGDQLKGFVRDEKNKYTIDFKKGSAESFGQVIDIKNDIIKEAGTLFLESSLFGKIFGIHLTFDFSSLSIKVKSDFELPIIRDRRLEKLRNGLNNNESVDVPDTILGRKYHLFRPGMLDWSVMSLQSWKHSYDTRAGLGLGAELLGGEANLFLNYSTVYKFDSRLQQYSWRWVNNDTKGIKQVQAGRIPAQTISSVYYPVIGVMAGNTPTTVRKAKGEYIISETTDPDWTVELYINGVLTDYTKADASGLFTFKVPYVYGYTTLTLKFYGLMGEERTENRVINIPYNFLPSGDFEYRISGGVLQDGNNTPMARGEASYGFAKNLTFTGGAEYLGSIAGTRTIPFVKASFLPASKVMMIGEYDHGVRTRGLVDVYPWKNALLELDYTRYVKGQTAIIFNYLEERKASLSVPVKIKNVSLFTKAGLQQNIYTNFSYNMAELLFSAYYKQYSSNLSTYANWINTGKVFVNTNLAVSARLKNGLTIRPSVQYNLTQGKILSLKAEVEKRFKHNGYLAASYEYNKVSQLNSVNLSLRFDLSFAQANASSRINRSEVSTFQSLRGSIAFGSAGKKAISSVQQMVGRGGISIVPFLDINGNGKMDRNEHKVNNLTVTIAGGRVRYDEKDTVINVVGLEPFIDYNLKLDDRDFDNISWRIGKKLYRILIDPNQFKILYVPVRAVGEIDGMAFIRKDSLQTGIGRILINVYNSGGSLAAQTLSESDGYITWLGLQPGTYTARVDSIQLTRLGLKSEPAVRSFTIKADEEGDIVDGIDFVLSGISEDGSNVSPGTISSDMNSLLKPEFRSQVNDDDQTHISVGSTLNESNLYYIQAGAFRDSDRVSKTVSGLRRKNIYAFGVTFENGLNKIRIGYFRNMSDANTYNELLKSIGFESFVATGHAYVYDGNLDLKAGIFFVQAGAFRVERNARRYLKKVSSATGYNAGITIEDGYYKVRLGYFSTESEAVKCYNEMINSGFESFRSQRQRR